MTKAIITSPFNKISGKLSSHRGAQAFIYASQLQEHGIDVTVDTTGKADFSQYDEIYVYHGNDFGGTLNLFGGVKDWGGTEILANFTNMDQSKSVYSLAIPFPDYAGMIGERLNKADATGKPIHTGWKNVNIKYLTDLYEFGAPMIDTNFGTGTHLMLTGERARRIVVGDSHAISLYRPGWMVNSVPYSTLYGSLKKGLKSFVSYTPELVRFTDIDLYFGNIDIRHHLCRLPDPAKGAIELAEAYVKAAVDLSNFYASNVSIYEPLPIENPSRKVPTTGFYKGTPFYGEWKERVRVRAMFIKTILDCIKAGAPISLVPWTDRFLNGEGELSFDHMEKPKSIHLSRASYPFWNGVDINTTSN